jgi:uroporphyrinogen decarboxylase
MTSRELVIRALSHQPTERPPREVKVDPRVERARSDEVDEVTARFPSDIIRLKVKYPDGALTRQGTSNNPEFSDAWGSVWQDVPSDNGAPAQRELIEAPLADLRNLSKYDPPMEVLEGLRLNKINRLCAETSRFTVAPVATGLVERVIALRGLQAARKDLSAGAKGIRNLLAMVHEYCLREVELWAESEADAIMLRDDFSSVPIVLEDRGLWRELLRPLYRDYCRLIRGSDKFLVFHTIGDVNPVLTDLIRCGIDGIEWAFPAADVERIAKRYRGRVTFFRGIDQPDLLVHGEPSDVRDAVTRVRRAFDYGSGGIIATVPWSPATSIEHVVACCEQWLIPMPAHV